MDGDSDPFHILERADRAYHDVAQLHFHEFATTDGGEPPDAE